MKIERLGVDEVRRLQAVRMRALRDAPDAFATTFEEASTWAPSTWAEQLQNLPTYIAVDADGDVGMVRCAEDGDAVWLISMWVAPESRGAGVGGALVDAITGWAHSRGAGRVLLDVAEANRAALALYRPRKSPRLSLLMISA